MNKKQKTLTIVMLALFLGFVFLTTTGGGNDHTQELVLGFIVLGVIYTGLFFVLKSPKKD